MTLETLSILAGLTTFGFGMLLGVLRWLRPLVRGMAYFLECWHGEPARPGRPAQPGIMEQLAAMEAAIRVIEREVTYDDGGSLKDQVRLWGTDYLRHLDEQHTGNYRPNLAKVGGRPARRQQH